MEINNKPLNNTPFTGIAGLKAHWKDDLLSGFLVSLIALPLCLGIAIASGVPPMAGLIAAIVGGMLMSRITGSFVTISGPAAGLIVVTLSAVESLGGGDATLGYQYALAAIVVAGIIQVIFGWLKVGKLGDFFPSAAVHGMLAAIGIIIMVKQLFVALGTKAEGKEILEVIKEIPHGFATLNPHIAVIALTSILILIIHPRIKLRAISLIPAPMWVIVFTIPLSHYFNLFEHHTYELAGQTYNVGPNYLVSLPDKIIEGITFPNFSKIGTGGFWVAVLSICLVSSIESLLSASAVDTLDVYKRKSNLNTDLSAMGGGSAISGLIGGLPMISEIVRSSANITNGGKTQWANFFHGGFLLLFLLFGKPIIGQIPMAALAAMLIHVGYKLAAPIEFKHVWEIGKAQLTIFTVTLVAVLATDLIIGIAIGILTKLIIHLIYGAPVKYLFRTNFNYEENQDKTAGIIHLKHSAIFSNYLSLKSEISKNMEKSKLTLDFKEVIIIDHTVQEHLHELATEWTKLGKELKIVNDDHLLPVSDHPTAAKIARKPNHIDIPGKVSITPRQKELADLAKKLGWKYESQKSISQRKYQSFAFTKGVKINYAQNIISSVFDGVRVEYAEIVLRNNISTNTRDTIIPTILLTPEITLHSLPRFTLEKEEMFDKVLEFAGFNDIDFDDHPEFSNKFLLKGENEFGIRDFFTDEFINHIQTTPDYHLESNGDSILIHRFDRSKQINKTKELFRFAKHTAIYMEEL
ncbi:SulP family inorganic anion transporter [Flexithrix dorotheae]|uniref:SulP family inorganic anion transporter n=1 Tax=Flexithrix dorotheae TaxID=70993 RepID=UPI0003743065|nr:SulP family inorganic anion transporter [Flexithrix dorotheae]